MYDTIRRQIIDGKIAPGAALDQALVAQQLGVSTTPLREAMRRLESEGLLTQVAHREMRVPLLSRSDLVGIYDIRMQLDPWAARLGTQRATDAQRAAVLEMKDFPDTDSVVELSEHHAELHRRIYIAAGNINLTNILDVLWDRSRRYRIILFGAEAGFGLRINEQYALVDAFVEGRAADAAKTLKQSLQRSVDLLVQRIPVA
ncbi:GntR family transcriptional regulator [Nocardia vaccinii]|uniref:GntR family transcriptional regulator n=1 Tax=Nocardia vaccinii TaxID=1822 RepID=UPI0008341E4C|nr:GntR family transcriptional regulator [Nocardia vaccinii]